MLSKKFRLRKLNTIIATSVLMGACLIFGQGQDASATGFRGVNSGASGAGRGRGTGTPASSSNLGGAGRGSSSSSIGTGSGGLGASGNLSGRRNSIGTGSGGASSSTFPGLPSSSGVRGTGSSASGSSSTLLGHGSDVRVQRLLQRIQEEIETGNGPNYGTYVALLEEVPNSTKYLESGGVRHKYSSGGTAVEIFVDKDGNLQNALVDIRGASGSSSSDARGASSSTSSASGSASLVDNKGKVQQLLDEIESDLQKGEGFPNIKNYNALLGETPDFIEGSGDGLHYKYSSGGGMVEMNVDPIDGSVKSALVNVNGKESVINFKEGWFQTSNDI